jgi:SPP1 gp7 family putative phage head morphogenesis protein
LTPEQAQALLTASQTKEARTALQALYDAETNVERKAALRARLDAPAYRWRISKLEAVRDQVYFDCQAITTPEIRYGEARLKDIYTEAYYREAYAQSVANGMLVPFSTITDRRAKAAAKAYWSGDSGTLGQQFSERIWENTTDLAEKVRTIVTEELMTGGNYQEMMHRLDNAIGHAEYRKKVNADGTAKKILTGTRASYRSARLIRTECNYVSGQATMESLQDAGVDQYIYFALLERRTYKVCGSLDGKSFPVSEQKVGVNMHPMHPNCRCFIGPYHDKDWLSHRTRSAQIDENNWEEVPKDMTYQEWYRKYVEGDVQAPKTLEELQQAKYNEPENAKLVGAYKRAIQSGELTPLVDFKLYQKTAGDIQRVLVGTQTPDGVLIAGYSKHYIARTIGSVEQRRNGVPVDTALKALTKPTEIRNGIKSRKYVLKGVCSVSVNPEDKILIQVNPLRKKEENDS